MPPLIHIANGWEIDRSFCLVVLGTFGIGCYYNKETKVCCLWSMIDILSQFPVVGFETNFGETGIDFMFRIWLLFFKFGWGIMQTET
jgi:hypothetical protein